MQELIIKNNVPHLISEEGIATKLYTEKQLLHLMALTANEVRKNGYGGHSTSYNVASKVLKDNP